MFTGLQYPPYSLIQSLFLIRAIPEARSSPRRRGRSCRGGIGRGFQIVHSCVLRRFEFILFRTRICTRTCWKSCAKLLRPRLACQSIHIYLVLLWRFIFIFFQIFLDLLERIQFQFCIRGWEERRLWQIGRLWPGRLRVIELWFLRFVLAGYKVRVLRFPIPA